MRSEDSCGVVGAKALASPTLCCSGGDVDVCRMSYATSSPCVMSSSSDQTITLFANCIDSPVKYALLVCLCQVNEFGFRYVTLVSLVERLIYS